MERKVRFEVNGQRIAGILHIPEKKNPPAIVMVHGFRIGKDEDHEQFILAARQFQKEGFLVLRFDWRGTDESEGKFEDMTIDSKVDDTLAAIEFVKKQNIDRNRIGILGKSFGGEISILAALKAKPKTLVLWAPTTDSKRFLTIFTQDQVTEMKTKGFTVTKAASTGKEYRIGRNFYETATKTMVENMVKNIERPTLIVHGDADERIPLEWSKKAYKNMTCEKSLKIIKNMKHSFEGHIDEAIELSLNWFKKHL